MHRTMSLKASWENNIGVQFIDLYMCMLRTATYNKKNLSENLVNNVFNSVQSGLNFLNLRLCMHCASGGAVNLIVWLTLDRSSFQVRALARDIVLCS